MAILTKDGIVAGEKRPLDPKPTATKLKEGRFDPELDKMVQDYQMWVVNNGGVMPKIRSVLKYAMKRLLGQLKVPGYGWKKQ